MARVQQAGAIAVNIDGPHPKFLVVTAKRDPTHWIFPKGHIEPGEAPEDAAVRELAEESGVHGTVIDRVGTVAFRYGNDDIEVTYFLIRATGVEPAREGRQLRWLDHDEARARLTFDNSRDLLDRAAAAVTS